MLKKYKICVYAICKNEELFVDRWMDSMSEADMVIVLDTGSTDATMEKLRNRGAIVNYQEVKPWRFDVARNISLSHVPDDADICVCTDIDEVFEPGWRSKLEKAWSESEGKNAGYKRVGKYIYNWSLKPDGSPDVQFICSKIHERHGFKWLCPIHEYVHGDGELLDVMIDGVVLNHFPDDSKSRGEYLPLLELAVKEAPQDARMRYYLGREYMYKCLWDRCICTLEEFLLLPMATWNEERCAAMRWIAKSHEAIGRRVEAYSWYYRAIAEAPHMRDPYVEFAVMCCRITDWPMALFLAEEALKIKDKSTTYVNMGYSWDYTPHDVAAIAAFWLGLRERSIEHAKNALNFEPNNERLRNNLAIISEM